MTLKRILFLGFICLSLLFAGVAQAAPAPPTCTVDTTGDGTADTTYTATHFVDGGDIWVWDSVADDYVNDGPYAGELIGTGDNDVIILPPSSAWPGVQFGKGKAGNDVICGSDGPDKLIGDTDDDIIYGGAGDDTILAQENDDIVYGGPGNDFINAGYGNDFVYGGDGDDTIKGFPGNDVIYAGAGNDFIHAGIGSDEVFGGDGNDIILGRDGQDILWGEGGDDFIKAGGRDDELDGGDGFDTCDLGAMDPDWISGGPRPAVDEHHNCEADGTDIEEPGEPPDPILTLRKTVAPATGACGVDSVDLLEVAEGQTAVKYCFTVSNVGDGNVFDIVLTDDAIPGFPADLLTLSDLDGQADAGDMASGNIVYGEFVVTLDLLQGESFVNTATLTANGTSTADSATVQVPGILAITLSSLSAEDGNATMLGVMLVMGLGLLIFGVYKLQEFKR